MKVLTFLDIGSPQIKNNNFSQEIKETKLNLKGKWRSKTTSELKNAKGRAVRSHVLPKTLLCLCVSCVTMSTIGFALVDTKARLMMLRSSFV